MTIEQQFKNALLANPQRVYQFFQDNPDLIQHLEKVTKSYGSFSKRSGVPNPAENLNMEPLQGFSAGLMRKQIIKIFQSVADPERYKGGLHAQQESLLLREALIPLAKELLANYLIEEQNEVSWRREAIDKLNDNERNYIKSAMAEILSRADPLILVRELVGGEGIVLKTEITADFLEKIADPTQEAHAKLMQIFDEDMTKILIVEQDAEDNISIKTALCLLSEDGIDTLYDWKKIYDQIEASFLKEAEEMNLALAVPDEMNLNLAVPDDFPEEEEFSLEWRSDALHFVLPRNSRFRETIETTIETSQNLGYDLDGVVDSEVFSDQPSSSVASSSIEPLTCLQKLLPCFR